MKMLGVEIADDFTVTEHVQQLAMSRAQTALRVLRTRGLETTVALQHVFRSTVDRCMQIAHGVVSPRHRIASASTWSSIAPVVMATARRTCRYSTTSATLLTMNFSLMLPDCQTTSCMHYYRHDQPHHNVMK